MKGKQCVCALALVGYVSLLVFSRAAAAQAWTALGGPVARALPSAVFDPRSGRMIVFGGDTIFGGETAATNLNDVWWLVDPDGPGLGWVQARPTGTKPAPRAGQSAVYDPVSDRMTVFGGGLGNASPCTNDVWVLLNASGSSGTPSWVQLSPSGGPPSPRLRFSAVYDPDTNSMIVFGGNDCFSANFSDVWVLSNANGLGGTPVWKELSPSGTSPGPTEDHTAVYDSDSNSMIVFGGDSGGFGEGSDEAWLLSNANGSGGTPSWSLLSPSGTLPPGRLEHVAVYDQANKRMTIYGGGNTTGTLRDSWVLSNADGTTGTPTWTQLGPIKGAPARSQAAAVYNSATNQMTVFGGNPTATTFSNATFVLSKANGLP
jgi:Galactose oxidase, central domain